MGRVLNIFSNKWDGSVGYGTFRQLRGGTVISQKSLGPTNEPTDIQIGNRKAMATIIAAGRPILGAIYAGFNELKVKNSPKKCANSAWGAYTGENRKYVNEVFTYTSPDNPTFVPANFIAGKGTIAPSAMTAATADVSDQEITLTWNPSSAGVGQSDYDLLWVVVYNETTDLWGVVTGVSPVLAYRVDGTISGLDSPVPYIISDVVRVYTFFQGQTNDSYPTTPFVFTGKESDSTNRVAIVSA